jgi:hypothetical protein
MEKKVTFTKGVIVADTSKNSAAIHMRRFGELIGTKNGTHPNGSQLTRCIMPQIKKSFLRLRVRSSIYEAKSCTGAASGPIAQSSPKVKSFVPSSFRYPVIETPPLILKDIVPKATASIMSLSDFIVCALIPVSSNSSKRNFGFFNCAVSYLNIFNISYKINQYIFGILNREH